MQGVAAPIEVCGGRKFPAGMTPEDVAAATWRDPPAGPWLAALKSSTDERVQLAALYVEEMIGVKPVEGLESLPPWFAARSQFFLERVTQLALHTQDPMVFAYASKACEADAKDRPASCAAYSPSDWAELDPDNGAAWAAVARQARRDGDADAEAAAFAQIAKSKRFDNYFFGLMSAAWPLMPNDTRPIDRYSLAVNFIGMEAAAATPSYQEFSRYCAAARMSMPAVRDECLRTAELMTSKGTSLLDLAIGTHVGERAGWSPSKVGKLNELKDAMMGALSDVESRGPEQLDCDHVNRMNAYFGQLGADGEVGALRWKLEQKGETNGEMARRWQSYFDELSRPAADKD